jgi:response regulator RpfG family c-di-GMP phosphodiesterase
MTDFLFNDQEEAESSPVVKDFWKVLLVDDEPSMHQVTQMVLANIEVDNKPLQFFTANSGREAKEVFKQEKDIALAFVDVVMESDEDGLELIDWIRNDFGDHQVRLILRTGQAGKAPEESVIRRYDINDYKEKTELTSQKLKSCVYSSIRSYRDIQTIAKSREGFKQVIKSSSHLLKLKSCQSFGSAILNELLLLLNVECSALCISRLISNNYDMPNERILAATGRYADVSDNFEQLQIDSQIKDIIHQTFSSKANRSAEHHICSYYETDEHTATVMYVEFCSGLSSAQKELLDIFSANIALIFESLSAREDIEESQLEMMNILAEAIENRGVHSGAHIKRLSLSCQLLAERLKLPKSVRQAIAQAASLHDIGKVLIPEKILNKPAKLNDDEYRIVQQHARLGAEILQKSKLPLARAGRKIALYHHENWDGSGYPTGLKGEDIPIEARVMAVADVLDNLASKRVYKEAWPDDKIKEYFISQRGIKFDPEIADIVVNYYEEFVAIRHLHPD